MSFIGCSNVTVLRSTSASVARTHFDCEPTGEHAGATNIQLIGNHVGFCRNGLLNVHGAANTPADGWVLRNTIQDGPYEGVKPPINLKMPGRSGFVSQRNRLRAAEGPGDNGVYQLAWWQNVQIRRDRWEFPSLDGRPSRHYGVELQDGVDHVLVCDNAFTGAAGERLDNPQQGVPVGPDVAFLRNTC
jgi:hypothetical protein